MSVWYGHSAFAQSISGHVLDDQNNPVAFANIYIMELHTGTPTDAQGKYFLTINPGNYNLVISAVGYTTVRKQVVVGDAPMTMDFLLQLSHTELKEIVVKASKKDPAYEIIQNAINNKHKYLSQVKSYKAGVYVKATEVRDTKKKTKPVVTEEEEDLSGDAPPKDPFADQKKKELAMLNNLSLVEMHLTLNYQYPALLKEERTAYKAYGQRAGLYIPLFSDADFNFYHNLVDLKGISEIPVISPISRLAVLSYKYKLEEALMENGKLVYKIKVTPYKTGDATCRGYIYINDELWNINRLELDLPKGGLKFYDSFSIKQTYQQIQDSLWIPNRQEFSYFTKAGSKSFEGNTLLRFSDYQTDVVFPARFFGNEVSVTTKEAYKRDSVYWNSTRPEPLSHEQQKLVTYRDSIEAKHSSKEYLDSVAAHFNKVRLGEVLYHGVEFRNHEKKNSLFISPLASMVGFEVVGGFRLSTYSRYFKRFESGRMLSASGSLSYGVKNQDPQGNVHLWTRYDPFRLADASLKAGRSFQSINNFDAYLNQLRISNYILHDYLHLFHKIELVNGLYLSTDMALHDRQSIDNYDRTSVINEFLKEEEPLQFEGYQALVSNVKLSYTPGQRYMTEPNRKVVLGSSYPTFSVTHRKGWNGLLYSDVDFDYVEGSIEQNLLLGTLGNSRYAVMGGKFVNTRDLRLVDVKRFRQSDPYLYSDPLHSFQLLDTSLITRNFYLEGHYIHHFNGAMINNLPLIKKTKIRTVAGAGFMWIQESNYRHQELFGGVERVFKLGARRRLRVGLFGVLAQANRNKPTAGYKISFDIIDTWKRDWSY